MKQELPKHQDLIHPYRVIEGNTFHMRNVDPSDTQGLQLKHQASDLLSVDVRRISALQQLLHPQNRWSLLLIFEGMDASGKDSAIRHTMSGVNPAGCRTHSFETPSEEELSHDFLWRASLHLPRKGHIGIFNRSYYEEVLVPRVHPDLLGQERIPETLQTGKIWQERYESIRNYERHLTRNGTAICKFLLHVSKEEQKRRFLKRLDRPDKRWKFSKDDVQDREHWDDYRKALEEAVRNTSAPDAPWYVVPGDHKWFARLVMTAAIITTLESLDLAVPRLKREKKKEIDEARDFLGHDQ